MNLFVSFSDNVQSTMKLSQIAVSERSHISGIKRKPVSRVFCLGKIQRAMSAIHNLLDISKAEPDIKLECAGSNKGANQEMAMHRMI